MLDLLRARDSERLGAVAVPQEAPELREELGIGGMRPYTFTQSPRPLASVQVSSTAPLSVGTAVNSSTSMSMPANPEQRRRARR